MNHEEQAKEQPTGMAPIVERNISALLAKRQEEAVKLRWPERLAHSTNFIVG